MTDEALFAATADKVVNKVITQTKRGKGLKLTPLELSVLNVLMSSAGFIVDDPEDRVYPLRRLLTMVGAYVDAGEIDNAHKTLARCSAWIEENGHGRSVH